MRWTLTTCRRVRARTVPSRWSTRTPPRKVSPAVTGLRPRTRRTVHGEAQAFGVDQGTRREPCTLKFVENTRVAGTVSFTTEG